MSKHNQYYSEMNQARPHNENYRVQADHEIDGVEYDQYVENDTPAEWNEGNDSYSYDTDQRQTDTVDDDYYLEPYSTARDDRWAEPTNHQHAGYHANEPERAFDPLFSSELPEASSSTELQFEIPCDEPPGSAYDEQDFVDAVTARKKSSGIQIYADDFLDCSPRPDSPQILKPVIFVGSAIILAIVATALAYQHQADLSADDIVKKESYNGIPQVAAGIRLINQDECSSGNDCSTDSVREIPAVNIPIANTESRQITSDTADVADTFVLADQSPNQVLVKALWSNVRNAPGMSGAIVTSLAEGTPVSIIGSSGNWYEVQTQTEKPQRGFMHRSTLESATK